MIKLLIALLRRLDRAQWQREAREAMTRRARMNVAWE